MGEREQKIAGRTSSNEQAAQALLAQDPQTTRMLQANAKLGNEAMQQKIHSGNVRRDELLAFLCMRLQTIRNAQLREVSAAQPEAMRPYARRIADSHKPEFSKPEPTRWHEPARLYDQAAYQLCRGQLAQGAQLMERAIQVERREFERLSRHIPTDDLETEISEVVGQTTEASTCGECDEPGALALVDDILRVTTSVEDPPVRPVRRPREEPEQEEDEEDKPKDGA
jgi:hypothetical protein